MKIKKFFLFILYTLLLDPFGIFDPALNFTGRLVRNGMISCYGQTTNAKIIDEIHYMKNRLGRSSIITYSYLFKADGEKYKSDSEDSTLKIGDKIEVEYVQHFPSIHKILPAK